MTSSGSMNKYLLKVCLTTFEKEIEVRLQLPITANNKEQARDYICDNSIQKIIDELCQELDLNKYKKKFVLELHLCDNSFNPEHLIYTIEDNIKNHLECTR